MIERLAEQIGFPEELAEGMPRVVLYGHKRMLIEQHRGIVVCRQEELAFQTGCGLLTVRGEQLRIFRYSSTCAVLEGLIREVAYGAR